MWFRAFGFCLLLLVSSLSVSAGGSGWFRPQPHYSHHEQRVTARRDARARRYFQRKNRRLARRNLRQMRREYRHKMKSQRATIRMGKAH